MPISDITPNKSLGQHFLHEAAIVERIVRAIAPRPGQHVVEIGPGLGVLTAPLLDRLGSLDVVEIDTGLAHALEQRFAGRPGLRIHVGDALEFRFRELCEPSRKLRLIGNLPYNISTPLIFHVLDEIACLADMVFMLQWEVGQRICAGPGSKTYGRLSVMTQFHCQPELLFKVGRGAFRPPPEVESCIVRLVPHPSPPYAISPALFARVVQQAFSQRRKTLRNALRGWVDEPGFRAAGVDAGLRAEALGVGDFARLAAQVAV
ncbi:MAG: 16S rRNA (adenine(1518)-N(6)/adenine(1519)-N(6))-dimethyltransferase RsmA [Gammaproteobacteria bacterium]